MKNNILTILLTLCIINLFAGGIELVSPANEYKSPSFQVTFTWNAVVGQSDYKLLIASDENFSNLLFDLNVANTSTSVSFNTATDSIFWKVISNRINGYIKSDVHKLGFINPIQKNTLFVWLKADTNVVMNPDSTISTWNNLIPNSINPTQSDPDKQPKLTGKVALLNNQPVVSLDGINDELITTSGGSMGSSFIVFNYNGGATFNNYNALLTNRPITAFDDYFITAQQPGTANFEGQDYFGSQGGVKGKMYLNLSPFPSLTTGLSLAPLQRYKIFAGVRTSILKNSTAYNIGNEPGSNRYWKGDIAEMIFSTSNSETAADSIQIYLKNKYAPPVALKDTILGSGFCTPVSVSAPNNYIEYLWSNGSTTPTTSLTPDKKYTLTTKDVFGFQSSTSFNVYPYQRLDNKTIFLCKGDTFKLDLKTPAGFTVSWNTGATTPQLSITQTGQYRVRITDPSNCFVDDTINVVIDEPKLSPIPNVSNNLTLCEGEKLFLAAPTGFESILWSTGNTENFITVMSSGSYSVYGITNSGCIINQPINITVAGKAPTAQFILPPACQGAPITFTDTSKAPTGNTIQQWSWTFSNNSTSNIQQPTTLFSSLGTQTVSLKITTNVGCTDSIAKIFTVNKKPVPSFYNLLSCAGSATTFVDQTVANAASLIDWKWDFAGLGGSNGIQNPAFRFPSATNYSVKLIATNSNFCSDSITLPISVNPSPLSNFSFDSVCGRSPVSYKFLATVPAPSTITVWNWSFGDGEVESAIKNPQHTYSEPGIYEVSLAVRSSNQCSDTVQKLVRIYDFPTVDFEVSSAQCVGKEIQFTDISTTPDGSSINKWTWYFAGMATSTQQNPKYTFNTEGNYTIQLTAKSAIGCSNTKQRSIAVSSLPQPKFTFTPANGLPPLNVSFTNQSPASGSYIWEYGDGSSPIAAYNPPAHTYTVKGSYSIKLIGTDFRGCVDTLTRYILIDKAYLDGVIAAVTLIPNGTFYKVQVTLQNNSNVEIINAGLALQLGGGAILRETWRGGLLPGRSTTFVFTGEVSAGDAQAPVICTTIENLNSYSPEDRTDNNTTCKELAVGDFEVFSIYPNPALENINLGMMLPQDGNVTIRLIDYLGQQLNSVTFSGIKGYNNISMNTTALGASVYIAEVVYKEQIIRKKFVRGNTK